MEGAKDADWKQKNSENCFDLSEPDNFENDFDFDECFDCSFHSCNCVDGKNFHILAFK